MANVKELTEALHQQSQRIDASEQRNRELERVRQTENAAAAEAITALNAKVDSLSRELTQAKAVTEATKKRLEEHTHPYACHDTLNNGRVQKYGFNTSAPNPPPPPPEKPKSTLKPWWL